MMLLALSWLALASSGAELETAEIGILQAHTFQSPMVNGMGTVDLAGLAGRPVLVEFWGTY